MRQMKEVWRSLVNIAKFWKVMWDYRWYDYGYALDILVKDLALREAQWGVNTHYIGDAFTKKRIQVLLRIYKRHKETSCWREEDKLLRKFLRMYGRNLTRFWD